MAFNQDLYEARANKGIKNYGLTVSAGSPVALGNWGSGFNTAGVTNKDLSFYPPVTGNTPASGLGQWYNATSGQYKRNTSGRFDDPRYYTATGTSPNL
jgi:hypothetical protein